jgi:hypothetical protein
LLFSGRPLVIRARARTDADRHPMIDLFLRRVFGPMKASTCNFFRSRETVHFYELRDATTRQRLHESWRL